MLQVHSWLRQGSVLLPSEGAVLLEPSLEPQELQVVLPVGWEELVPREPPEPEREPEPPGELVAEPRGLEPGPREQAEQEPEEPERHEPEQQQVVEPVPVGP